MSALARCTPPARRLTPTHRSALPACAPSCKRCARAKPGFPICAISGINAGNAGEMIAAGADGVAVISALSRAADPAKAAQESARGGGRRARAAGQILTEQPDRDCRHHRRFGFERRRRHPGGPENLCGARRVWRKRHHGADRSKYARRERDLRRVGRFYQRPDRRHLFRSRGRCGEDRHAVPSGDS